MTNKISTFFPAVVIFAIFITGGALTVGLTQDAYNVSHTNNTQFSDTFGKVAELTEETNELQQFVDDSTTSGSGAWTFITNGLGNVISVVWTAFKVVFTMIGDFMTYLPLPSGFGTLIASGIIGISVAWLVFKLIAFIRSSDI